MMLCVGDEVNMLTLENCITDKEYEIKEIAAAEPYKSRLETLGLHKGIRVIARHRGSSGAVVEAGELKLALSKKLTDKIILARIEVNE